MCRTYCIVCWIIFIVTCFADDQYVEIRLHSFDGADNHIDNFGAAGTPFVKAIDAVALADDGLPSARKILQDLYLIDESPLSTLGWSQARAYWGLLLYYDLVDVVPSNEEYNIPCDDGVSDSQCVIDICDDTGSIEVEVPYFKAQVDADTGLPINAATAFCDLDCVYGRSKEASDLLRTFEGGKLKLTDQGLPEVEVDLDSGETKWLIADQRFTEFPGTFALLTLLMREHNRRADELNNSTYLAELESTYGCTPVKCTEWTDEELFLAAREYVIAAYQHISMHEFAPKLVGLPSSSDVYGTYDDTFNPRFDLMAAIAFRWPYFALGPIDKALDSSWNPNPVWDLTPVGSICSYEDLNEMIQSTGIDGLLRGMMFADGAEVNAYLPPRSSTSCLDAPIFDIQTSRDFGMPSYNDAREALGFDRVAAIDDISSDSIAVAALNELYGGNVDLVDMLVGGLVETKKDSTVFGDLLSTIIYNQLANIKPSDKYWHSHSDILEDTRSISFSGLALRNPDPVGTFGDNYNETIYPTDGFSAIRYVPSTDTTAISSIIFMKDVFELSWTIDEDNDVITFNATIAGMNDGYFGLGFGEKMIGADIFAFVTFQKDNGTVEVTDRYAYANKLPEKDEVFNGTNDVLYIEHTIVDDTWTVVFQKNLTAVSSDKNDTSFIKGDMSIIYSYNLDSVAQHDFLNRGVHSVNFYTGENYQVTSSQQMFFMFHGIVMLFAWGICGPIAFYVVRYKKHWDNWLEIHELFASFAVEASVPIAIAAFATADGKFRTSHGQIGLVLLLLIIFQFSSGLMRKAGIENRGNIYFGTNYDKKHQLNKFFHRYLGRFVVVLGIANVIMGLDVISPSDSTLALSGVDAGGADSLNIEVPFFEGIHYFFYFVLAVLGIVFIGSEINLQYQKHKTFVTAEQKFNLPTLTMEQFNEKLLEGKRLLLIHDAVVDVSKYIKNHPGGSKVLRESIGTEVSREILGSRGVGQSMNDGQHKHSGKAWLAIQNMIVAYIKASENNDHIDDIRARTMQVARNSAFSSKGILSSTNLSDSPFIKFVLRSKTILSMDDRGWPIVNFVFEPKQEKILLDPLQIGYFHKFRALYEGNTVQRSYTPVGNSLANENVKGFQYNIRIHPSGQMSKVLAEMAINDCIRVQGPFDIRQMMVNCSHIYMICAGTGVNPMLQLLRGQYNRLRTLSKLNQTKFNSATSNDSFWRGRGINPLNIIYPRNSKKSIEEYEESKEGDNPNDDLLTQLKEGRLPCAKSLVLLWQTHSDKDSFCLSDLEELSDGFLSLQLDDITRSAAFYYTNYANEFVINKGVRSLRGRQHGIYVKSLRISHIRDKSAPWYTKLLNRRSKVPHRLTSKSSYSSKDIPNTRPKRQKNYSILDILKGGIRYLWSTIVYVATGFEVQLQEKFDSEENDRKKLVDTQEDSSIPLPSSRSFFPFQTAVKLSSVPKFSKRVENMEPVLLESENSERFEMPVECDGARNEIVEGKITENVLRLHLAPFLENPHAFASDKELSRQIQSNTIIFVSGPPGFVDTIEMHMNNIGIPPEIVQYLD